MNNYQNLKNTCWSLLMCWDYMRQTCRWFSLLEWLPHLPAPPGGSVELWGSCGVPSIPLWARPKFGRCDFFHLEWLTASDKYVWTTINSRSWIAWLHMCSGHSITWHPRESHISASQSMVPALTNHLMWPFEKIVPHSVHWLTIIFP